MICPESIEKIPGLEWTGASPNFLWTSPWKASSPPKSFKSSHGRNISSHEIRATCEHCSPGCGKWSHNSRCGAFTLEIVMLPTDGLREKSLSAMGKSFTWQDLLFNENMFQEEGGGAWYMSHSWKTQEGGSWCVLTHSLPRSKPVSSQNSRPILQLPEF